MLDTYQCNGVPSLPEFYPSWMKDSFRYFEKNFNFTVNNSLDLPSQMLNIVQKALFPGRRIRPILYCSFWKDIHHKYPENKKLFPAIALELFHSASIIIDDIVDEDEVRRNKHALYRIFGIGNAVIVSHFLISAGYKQLLQSTNSRDLTKYWTYSYESAAVGEFIDVNKIEEMSIEEQVKNSLLKTENFFLFIGNCLHVFSDVHDDIVKLFGIIGRCFQISNDIYDLYNIDGNSRHSIEKPYRLNYSYLVTRLVKEKILKEEVLLKPIYKDEIHRIAMRTRDKLGRRSEVITPIIHSALQELKGLNLSINIKNHAEDFLILLKKSNFWRHIHETKKRNDN
ncbi:MAG: polyprenyl synthetase family protein [Candidatus Aminicenantes bacterium]|nr:polyprenyl synthetase family protein [Candidatus Aminicenantes bacterium]